MKRRRHFRRFYVVDIPEWFARKNEIGTKVVGWSTNSTPKATCISDKISGKNIWIPNSIVFALHYKDLAERKKRYNTEKVEGDLTQADIDITLAYEESMETK